MEAKWKEGAHTLLMKKKKIETFATQSVVWSRTNHV